MTPRPYRTSKTTQLHIRVSPEGLKQIQQAASNRNQSTSDYVRSKIMEKSLYDQADDRVCDDDDLLQYRDFIMADWPEGDKHWKWVIEAPKSEILSWVKAAEAAAR